MIVLFLNIGHFAEEEMRVQPVMSTEVMMHRAVWCGISVCCLKCTSCLQFPYNCARKKASGENSFEVSKVNILLKYPYSCARKEALG